MFENLNNESERAWTKSKSVPAPALGRRWVTAQPFAPEQVTPPVSEHPHSRLQIEGHTLSPPSA